MGEYIESVEQALKSREYDLKKLEEFRDNVFRIDEDFIPEVAVTKDMIRRHLLDMSRAEEFKNAVKNSDKENVRRLFRSATFILGPEDPIVQKGATLIGAKDTDRYEVQAILQELLKRTRTNDVAELIKIAEE